MAAIMSSNSHFIHDTNKNHLMAPLSMPSKYRLEATVNKRTYSGGYSSSEGTPGRIQHPYHVPLARRLRQLDLNDGQLDDSDCQPPLSLLVRKFPIICGPELKETQTASFVHSLVRRFHIPYETLFTSVVYMLRITNRVLKEGDVCGHCLSVVCLLIASKFHEDENRPTNREWAKAAGLPVEKVNVLETMALKALDFRLHVSAEFFKSFSKCYDRDPLLLDFIRPHMPDD